MNILSFVDPNLVSWVLVANVAGYWLKQRTWPRWFPPIPLMLFLLNFVICSLIGWALTDAEGWKAITIAILEYGIGNGVAITLMATFGYDVVHSIHKRVVANRQKEENTQDD